MTKDQVILDVMTTAREGGCDYWADYVATERNAEGDVISMIVRDSEDADAPDAIITPAKVEEAMVKLSLGEVLIRADLRQQVITALTDPESADIDADAADCIIQVAAYGEIVFC